MHKIHCTFCEETVNDKLKKKLIFNNNNNNNF